MLSHCLKLHNQRGDTIVEVLISIAVVSLVLAAAYVTTNHSLLSTRDAQERGNGLKLVESQLEQLKSLASTNPDQIFNISPPFCITPSNTTLSATNAACTITVSGGQPQYKLSIDRNDVSGVFTVTNQWDNIRGDSTDQIQMKYRVYR